MGVDVNEHKVVEHVKESVLDEGLKQNKGISQTKASPDIKSVPKECFPLISFLCPDEMVCITEVHFQEEPCMAEEFK